MNSFNRIKKNYDCIIKSTSYNSKYYKIININNIKVNNRIELKNYIKNELNIIFKNNNITPDLTEYEFDIIQSDKNFNIITDIRNFFIEI